MPQLDPTWFVSQLFWLGLSFGFLYLLLSLFVLPPLQTVIASRKGAVDWDLETAQALKSAAEHAKQSYEHTLLESREMAHALMNEAEATSKARAAEANKALDAQVAAKLAHASTAIAAKKKALLEALNPATVELSKMIVEKLTHSKPSEADVKRALADLGKN